MHLDSSAIVSDPELVQVFLPLSLSYPCDRDRTLFVQRDFPSGLYILSSGSATLKRHGAGGPFEITVQTTAPSLIGLRPLLQNTRYAYSLVVHKGSTLGFVHAADFEQMIEADRFLAHRAAEALAESSRFSENALFDLLDLPTENAA